MHKSRFLLVVVFALFTSCVARAASLRLDTDYRIRGVNYTNTDFDTTTSTDALAYYSQRLQLTIAGEFAPGVEIGSRITAIGVVGSTATIFAVPYPNTGFSPFIENAYIKFVRFVDGPVDLTIGKQSITIGDGVLVSDNGVGFFALRARAYNTFRSLPWEVELLTAKINERFSPAMDRDLYGGIGRVTWKDHLWELGYFEDRDRSGTIYQQGASATPTLGIVKKFYDFRLGHRESAARYQLEIARQSGYVRRPDGSQIALNGTGYLAYGELIGEKTKLGRVSARALFAVASGDDTATIDDDDESFSPDLTATYDGLERAGFGKLFGATPTGSFFALHPEYSGINTLNVGASFSPLYAWTFGVDYFLYSASMGPRGAPTASGFERLFGAEFTLGVELDLSVKFAHSRYFETKLSYSRYTPPRFENWWPKLNPATRYELELSARF